MKDLKSIIGNNIARLRTERGITQLELAQKLNYSDKSVSKWERCESVPDIYVLVQLSELFSCSVEQLITEYDGEEKGDEHVLEETCTPPSDNRRSNTVILLSVAGVWTLSAVLFVISWICSVPYPAVFVYALPVSALTALVLNSTLREGRGNCAIVCVLTAGILLSLYTVFRQYNIWQIFLLVIPAYIIIFLASKLRK